MNKMLLVLKNEFRTVVFRKSFFLTLFLVPIIATVVFTIFGSIGGDQPTSMIGKLISPPEEVKPEGLVDQSGLIEAIPVEYKDKLLQFKDESAANAALQEGQIGSYYIIPPDFLETGDVTYLRTDFNPFGGMDRSEVIQQVIRSSLLKGEPLLLSRIEQPYNVEVTYISQQPVRDAGNFMNFMVPYVVTMLFYMVILTSSSMMLSSITNEKENRVMEVLMTSITPTQMLSGKIIALGLVGLLQTVVWSGYGYLIAVLSRNGTPELAGFQISPALLIWGMVFFLLGYGIYAALMAGIGALVPNLREASQATTIVILPLIVPLFFLTSMAEKPNGPISLILSLFPLTSPITMMARLSSANVPWWQMAISIFLLLVTVYLLIRAVAGMFRAQRLLSGQAFNLKLFVNALIGKA
ncbi:ABC-type Na+ efflux pump, permease component [Longilinea arvoryzae]|uniref:ABC-type Na+ efflux pump, permease component n=1 Tax=Longilinea arvoryzae TaxID=360412 RepID=A0A0S7BK46_9CHLR|nr:ABC transporter permease [Longilinea arvoryzae]GAP14026.1 ABC-type Na+ efflux pump, permease component [Longilinea arvoryzae]